MRFLDQDSVATRSVPSTSTRCTSGNWASTRYVPWTSWAAAANVWPSAGGNSSTEAET